MNLKSRITKQLNPSDTVLIHGTSVDAALDMINSGVFNYGPRNPPLNNHLFFAPNYSMFPEKKARALRIGKKSFEHSVNTASGYANLIGIDHYVFRELGIIPKNIGELSPTELSWGVDKFLIPELEELGIDKAVIPSLQKGIHDVKGVIIGFGPNVLKEKIKRGTDEPENEVRIYCPDGISGAYVTGIVPLGKYEKERLNCM